MKQNAIGAFLQRVTRARRLKGNPSSSDVDAVFHLQLVGRLKKAVEMRKKERERERETKRESGERKRRREGREVINIPFYREIR